MIDTTLSSFERDVIEASLEVPVIVDFWAPWCGPCKAIAPVLDELAGEYDGKLTIAKVNVDEQPATAEAFGIMSIPTMILFKDGKPVGKLVGALPKAQIKKFLEGAA